MELFKLLGTIAIKNNEANEAIEDTTGKAETASNRMMDAFKKVGTVIATAFAADKIIGFGTACVNMYADYEQLVGGVETLFGATMTSAEEYAERTGASLIVAERQFERYQQRAEQVLQDADEAYLFAGMSANEYMETVNGFAASLIGSLGEYQGSAGKYARNIVTDMADNANKMGTSMEMIQNAYNGFAKGNFTMLDNLKLGYGGTKEEMERLLATAAEIEGVGAFDINSFADITDAIHIIQDSMGITGTTAKEASETIAGSFASMKSAWTNFLTGLGKEDVDMSELFEKLTESIETYAENLIPTIQRIVGNIGDLVVSGLSEAIRNSGLQNVFSDEFLESFETAWGKIEALMGSLETSAIETFQGAIEAVNTVLSELAEILQPIVEVIILNAIQGFEAFIRTIETVVLPVVDFLIEAFTDVVTTITDAIQPTVEEMAKIFQECFGLINDAYTEWILPTVESFIEMVEQLWLENQDKIEKLGELFRVVFEAIKDVIVWFKENILEGIFLPAIRYVCNFVNENMEAIKQIFQNAFDIIGGIIDFFIALFTGNWEGLWESVKTILQGAKEAVEGIFNLLFDFISGIWTKIKDKISEVIGSIIATVKARFNAVKTIVSTIFTNMKNALSDIWDAITGFIEDACKAIGKVVDEVVEKVLGAVEAIKEAFESITGTASGDMVQNIKVQAAPLTGGAAMLPQMAEGGILEKGQVGILEGNGAEAVVPLHNNSKWISRVAADMDSEIGSGKTAEKLVELLQTLIEVLPEAVSSSVADGLSGVTVQMDRREMGRMVREYA